ncbi:MAG TPA: hypothetical protein VHZ74_03595, partial [Bryobacteraceae bacterium]|nr:hypothetical protein [Bryobacteraceae bacterium]
ASNILPGLPNFGIAQGSVFVVYGAAMGPSTIVVAPTLPLQTSLGSTSIQVTVGGTTVNAPMLYTLKSQLAGVLPSNTPVGTGTLTVTYNGASGSTPITVVKSNFGISTVNQSGTGPGVVTFADYSLVTGTKSAKPGDTLIIWGTGLGPINGNDAAVPAGGDLGTPITVYIGGAAANVTYRGRSGEPGLDQINVVVPPGLSGCYISVVVQTGNTVSNTTTTAISPNGGTCSDPNGLQLSTLQGPLNSKGTASIGIIDVVQESISFSIGTAAPPTTTTIGVGAAVFEKYTALQLTSSGSPLSQASVGSCILSSFSQSLTNTSPPSTGPTVVATGLDAGSAIVVNPPSGNPVNLTPTAAVGKGYYGGSISSLSSGAYEFSNGSGGADIGAFSTTLTFPGALNWTNQTAVTSAAIDRTQPLNLTWTGGDPASSAFIEGYSVAVTANTEVGAFFVCTGPISAGKFTVPPSVLLSLPASGNQLGTSLLLLGTTSNPQTFTAPGLDAGFVFATSLAGGSVAFK